MVKGQSRRGYKDWSVQRFSAVLIGAYALFMVVFLLNTPHITYIDWIMLFSHLWVRVATVMVVLAVCWHAWIGLWTVFTDYVKCGILRLFLEVGLVIVLVGYLVWCLDILWG